jgi:hypothetical protein
MSKVKKVQSQDDFEAELKSEVKTYDSFAVSMIKQGPGEFKIIRIPVDSKTLAVGDLEVIGEGSERSEAVEKFKIAVVSNGVI